MEKNKNANDVVVEQTSHRAEEPAAKSTKGILYETSRKQAEKNAKIIAFGTLPTSLKVNLRLKVKFQSIEAQSATVVAINVTKSISSTMK